MIEGLHFDISSNELKEHFKERIAYHQKKTEVYKKEAEKYDEPTAREVHLTSFDPRDELLKKGEKSSRKIQIYKFMHDHIVPGEIYRLSESDLRNIQIIETSLWRI